MALAVHAYSQHGGYKGFAHTALSAHNADDLFHLAFRSQSL